MKEKIGTNETKIGANVKRRTEQCKWHVRGDIFDFKNNLDKKNTEKCIDCTSNSLDPKSIIPGALLQF